MPTPSDSLQAVDLHTYTYVTFVVFIPPSYHNMGPSKQFAFVNISHPEEGRSRRVLTSVRRHVMADVGRAKRKRPKWKIVPLEISSRGRSPEGNAAHVDTSETPPLARMPPSFQTHLVDPDTHACELINFSESWSIHMSYRLRFECLF
jgi:hypothetical protein